MAAYWKKARREGLKSPATAPGRRWAAIFVTHSIAPTDSTASNPKNDAISHKLENVIRLLPKLSRETARPRSGSSSEAKSAIASTIRPAWRPRRQLGLASVAIQDHARTNQKR